MEEVEEPATPEEDLMENDVLVERKFSDKAELLKSLADVIEMTAEGPFYMQKSTLSIFRFEDVVFNVFPNLAQLKRKGATTAKEIFQQNDPFA